MFIQVYHGGKVNRSIQEPASAYPHPDWSVALLICMLLDNSVALHYFLLPSLKLDLNQSVPAGHCYSQRGKRSHNPCSMGVTWLGITIDP